MDAQDECRLALQEVATRTLVLLTRPKQNNPENRYPTFGLLQQ